MNRPVIYSIHRKKLLALGLSVLLLSAFETHATLPVYDPFNYAQNVLTASRALQQVNNQIQSLQNETQMLVNQARNLSQLPYSALGQIEHNVAKTQGLIRQAQSLAQNVDQIDQAFQSAYGRGALSATDKALVTNAQTRWANTVGGLRDALKAQATIMDNLQINQAEVSKLVKASQSSTGALAAAQAGNQLLALQAQQLSDLTALLAANGRAQALKDAESATASEQGREQRRRFLTPKKGYQAGNAQMFYGN
jgi:P-type conjugative transfer protein TrbJ